MKLKTAISSQRVDQFGRGLPVGQGIYGLRKCTYG